MANDEKPPDELVESDAAVAETPAPRVAEAVMRRQRRWVWAWAIATAALWAITALYLLVLVGIYLVLVHPAVNELLTGGELGPVAQQEINTLIVNTVKALFLWPVALTAAAICTILFTLASRRATLRQIQASLAEISAQLKQMAEQP
jgi:hypothetical protein